jgi:hypothetical protein
MPVPSTIQRCRKNAPVHAAWIVLPLLGLAACATQQELVKQKEDNLSAAGFMVRPANTPERQAMLNRLPPDQFVRRVRGDDVTYVYADPKVCGCLYIGTQQAYNTYKLHEQQQRLADQQQTTAQMYADPSWNWSAWGPMGAGFTPGFGGGFGW